MKLRCGKEWKTEMEETAQNAQRPVEWKGRQEGRLGGVLGGL